jgi:hypothetical protein
MTTFINICKKLQVPIADEKTEGPTCVMEYLGLDVAMYKRLLSALPAGIALVQNADKD